MVAVFREVRRVLHDTGVAALALGRQFVGLELSPEYAAMAQRRITRPHAPVQKINRDTDSMPLFPEEIV